jgi:hypothetical protein
MSILTVALLNLALAILLVGALAALMSRPLRARKNAKVTALREREERLRRAA